MNNQEIIDNAPEGATHVEVLTDYKKIYYYRRCYKDFCNKFMYDVYQQGTWYICSDISGEFRSLADIKRIAELENHIQSLKVINEYIDEGCPDIQVVRSDIGEVISRAEGTYLKAPKEKGAMDENIELVKKWLANPKSVRPKKLKDNYNTAHKQYYAADDAFNNAANTTDANTAYYFPYHLAYYVNNAAYYAYADNAVIAKHWVEQYEESKEQD